LPVRGYRGLSLTDDFEWTAGYTERFDLNGVGFANQQKRSFKDSDYGYSRVTRANRVT
jgi:beta-glucosidase/6-phospho-beta-glucosidase/beta-galactosidase